MKKSKLIITEGILTTVSLVVFAIYLFFAINTINIIKEGISLSNDTYEARRNAFGLLFSLIFLFATGYINMFPSTVAEVFAIITTIKRKKHGRLPLSISFIIINGLIILSVITIFILIIRFNLKYQ